MAEWQRADRSGERFFPHEFLYRLIRSGVLEEHYQIDPKDSCLAAAAERDLPIVVPGWEDSTSGNIFAAHCLRGDVKNVHTVKTGIEYMMVLSDWYTANCDGTGIGFFQIERWDCGRLSDLCRAHARAGYGATTPLWSYFCQISDSTTSYGSYSGAVPNEKITWGKLGPEMPRFLNESDATIVAPLIFQYVLETVCDNNYYRRDK